MKSVCLAMLAHGEGKGAAKNEAHSSMKYTQIQQLSKNEEGFVGMLHLMQQATVNHIKILFRIFIND